MEIAATLNAALTRQAIALEVVKSAAKADQKVADILAQSADNIAALSGGRGSRVDIRA